MTLKNREKLGHAMFLFGIGLSVVAALVGGAWYYYWLGAIAHAEGRVAVTTLPDGSKVVTTVKENK